MKYIFLKPKMLQCSFKPLLFSLKGNGSKIYCDRFVSGHFPVYLTLGGTKLRYLKVYAWGFYLQMLTNEKE